MGWKPKEKPLTAEEAVEIAKKELAPCWFGSKPLLASLRGPDGRVNAYPLDQDFLKIPRLIFVFDPMLLSGEEVTIFVREWYRRYHSLGLEFLLVIRPSYRFFQNRQMIERMVQRKRLPLPVVLDGDGTLGAALGVPEGQLPAVILFHKNQFILRSQGKDWFKGAEPGIQKFLRAGDPGLALLPPYEPGENEKPLHDAGRIEFGKAARVSLKAAGVSIAGRWEQDEEKIATTDPEAMISFRSPGAHVSVIAESQAGPGEQARIEVLVDGGPVWDEVLGEDLHLGDAGVALVDLEKPDLYRILAALPVSHRGVTLRFSTANLGKLALYGLRFGD